MALTRKQFEAINDLFDAGGDESAVLEKHKIKLALWLRWQKDKSFCDEIARRMGALERQGQILIAKYRPVAIANLVGLCNNENNETSRRSCIDMINLLFNTQKPKEEAAAEKPQEFALSPEAASELLGFMAKAKKPTKEFRVAESGAEIKFGPEVKSDADLVPVSSKGSVIPETR